MKTYEDKDFDDQMKEIPDYAEDARQKAMAEAAEAERIASEFREEAYEKKRKNQRTTAWVLGIVALLCIGFIIAWIVGWNDVSSEQVAVTRVVQPVKRVYVRHVIPTQTANVKAVNAVNQTAGSGSAYDDRIEREAREVIHGDFGVNPGRKARLGADYAAVQARVNQMLAAN